MSPQTLFYIIVAIILIDFVIDQILDALNAKHFNDPIPAELQDVYDKEEYQKSQQYKKDRYRFGMVSSTFSLLLLLVFLFFEGFAYVNSIAESIADNQIIVALVFFRNYNVRQRFAYASFFLVQYLCNRRKVRL